ncbi:hypothetical protein RZ532_00985 [Nitratireductor aquimarinus]|uniref:hypothetical protein n=1 Tax=Nitratireductor aquimarinus TaxID=889300 RepID=UPI0029355B00|nr:hypothetical protein [Nitratireductor aquimarinus]MDV2964535.1 hypothetical protein [Nitratireductor aquimarinus]
MPETEILTLILKQYGVWGLAIVIGILWREPILRFLRSPPPQHPTEKAVQELSVKFEDTSTELSAAVEILKDIRSITRAIQISVVEIGARQK